MLTPIQIKRVEILKMTLWELYKDNYLKEFLVFKWGTSLMLFYGLPRFSEDLDFSLVDWYDKELISLKTNHILKSLWFRIEKYINNKENSVGKKCYYNIDWEEFELKLEISNRTFNTPLRYTSELLNINNRSIPINLLELSQNFAHKICAFFDRNRWRDTVDIYYYLKNDSPIDKDIIYERLWDSIDNILNEYISVISKIENRKRYIWEIDDLINWNEILISGYYLDWSIEKIYNYWMNISLFSNEELDNIYHNILDNDHLYQLNGIFYVIQNNNWFIKYFENSDSYYWIINFSDNKLLFETSNIDDLINFIKDNQLLFI